MDGLEPHQIEALTQLRDLTNGADDDVSINVLASVDWDVQRAAEFIFGGGSIPAAETHRATPTFEPLEIDDSEQDALLPPSPAFVGIPTGSPRNRASPILTILAYPLHILSSIFRFIFTFLRIPIPRIPLLSRHFSLSNFYRPQRRPTARGGPDRWIRDLEEETGAVCIGRANQGAQGVASGSEAVAGPSHLTSRTTNGTAAGPKYLPDFVLGTYEQTLTRCQKENKIACIVLVSEEHDDTAEFKRNVLTDSEFVRILTDNDFIVWGGDVSDVEAYSASEKLQATTYPFVAFIATQATRSMDPSGSNRRSGSSPSLTVLSRHQGSPLPSGPTHAQTLTNHLTTNLLPRVLPYLQRLRQSQLAIERDRMLRMEQDQAFAQSAQRDKERILRKMDEERRAREAEQRRIDEETARAIAESEREAREEAERQRKASERGVWKAWFDREIVKPETPSDTLRVAIRLPDGKRIVRRFGEHDTLTTLYAFIDVQLPVPAPSNTPTPPFDGPVQNVDLEIQRVLQTSSGQDHTKWWGFSVTLAYPRKPISWAPGVLIHDLDTLKGGQAQLVVDLVDSNPKGKKKSSKSGGDDSDEYNTESDEE